jgi:cystathionine beta-lyase/cystathionine gamma-synthase
LEKSGTRKLFFYFFQNTGFTKFFSGPRFFQSWSTLAEFIESKVGSQKFKQVKEQHCIHNQMTTIDESLVLSFSSDKKGYYYNRSSSPEYHKLKTILQKRHETKTRNKLDCLVTSSGMSSISSLVQTIVSRHKQQLNIVYASELYIDTSKLFKNFSNQINSGLITEFNVLEVEELKKLFETKLHQENTILFFESCSNPHGLIFGFSILPQLRALSKNLYVIVDNTWLTESIFNPLNHDVDFVVMSLTKYYSGGVAIGGAIVSDHSLLKEVGDWMKLMGHHVSPHNCRLVVQNMKTIDRRILSSSNLAKQVVGFAKSHPRVSGVSYPFCEDHPCFALAKSYFSGGPGVFVFRVKASKNRVMTCLKKIKTLEFKTSFGSKFSRIDPWPKTQGQYVDCRLAIGYDDNYERVVKGLNELLEML